MTSKLRSTVGALLATCAFLSLNAFAAIPTEVTTAATDLTADAPGVIAAFWPVIIAVVGVMTFMKLFKKAVSRST